MADLSRIYQALVTLILYGPGTYEVLASFIVSVSYIRSIRSIRHSASSERRLGGGTIRFFDLYKLLGGMIEYIL